MLAKLFKHELIDLFRKTIIFFSVVIGLSVIVFFLSKLTEVHIIFGFVNGLFLLGYFLAVFGIILYSIFYPVTRYYKSMLKDEGYLTHTLPVTKGQLLFAKLVSAFLLFLVSVVIFAISFSILASMVIPYEDFKILIESLLAGVNDNIFLAVLLTLIYLIIYYFGTIMMFITALTVGHSASSKKGLNSFLAGLAIYGIQQVLGFIAIILIFVLEGNFIEAIESGTFNPLLIPLASMIMYGILATVEIIVTGYFLKNKLNIE